MFMSKNDTRSKILKAAAYIVQSDGILSLTLEAAAKQAGVSKGGLLYHFPSKDALVAGMVQHPMQNYIDNIEKNVDQDTLQHGRGRWTRSFIKGTFEQSNPDKHMDAGLMAAATINRDLLKPVQDAYEQWQDHIDNDGLDPINATILRLAVDGLWFSEIFELAPLEDDRRQRVLERLIQLTKEE
ncbi:TetR/AcrR family transcriptional regulator [Virgibacillus alimentarius]|uniref:TetR/AcrR family transcriptional regulator n=2 Tax=Virgibacillus alimentarius TaxID=698769 RepID=UPI00299DAD50|nr:TetR/AcrR family transcriptional regulator [Virgibacillus alimentarius]